MALSRQHVCSESGVICKAGAHRTRWLWCRLWRMKPFKRKKKDRESKVRSTSTTDHCLSLQAQGGYRGRCDDHFAYEQGGSQPWMDMTRSSLRFPSGMRQLAAQEAAKRHRPSQVVKTPTNAQNGNLEALKLGGGLKIRSQHVHYAGQCRPCVRPDASGSD